MPSIDYWLLSCLFSSNFKALKLQLALFLGLNCLYLFFKCFTERRASEISLFYYSTLMRWQYFSPVRDTYFSIASDENADIFADSMLYRIVIFHL